MVVVHGGEKESSVPELCSLESVCGQACAYRHIARCVFTTIFINYQNFDNNNNKINISIAIRFGLISSVLR